MNTTIQTTASAIANLASPTEKQINRLYQLGVLPDAVPATRSDASQMITKLIAARDMQPATLAQRGRAGVLGGRDLPGAGVREVSSQIALLEALALFDAATSDEDAQLAVDTMIARVRERFTKAISITIKSA